MRPSGRKNVPGKPIQYSTTEKFLEHFNIEKLTDLPSVDELSSAGLIDDASIGLFLSLEQVNFLKNKRLKKKMTYIRI